MARRSLGLLVTLLLVTGCTATLKERNNELEDQVRELEDYAHRLEDRLLEQEHLKAFTTELDRRLSETLDQLEQTKRELLGVRRYSESIVKSMPLGLLVFDGDLQVVFCNQRIEEFFGLTPGTVVQLHQRSPAFCIRYEGTELALDREVAEDIFVTRIEAQQPG